MLLPALFHWSPADRFGLIRHDGLHPHSPPTVSTGTTQPYVCLSPTPSSAWGLSGDMDWVTEHTEWDLWQVRLTDGDQIQIRGDFCPVIREVRVYGVIPADRVWWVARRGSTEADVCLPVAKAEGKKAGGKRGKGRRR